MLFVLAPERENLVQHFLLDNVDSDEVCLESALGNKYSPSRSDRQQGRLEKRRQLSPA